MLMIRILMKRKKATLDNIVSIMRRDKGPAKEEGFDNATTLGPLAARVTPRFKTLQEIKNNRDRIDQAAFDDSVKECNASKTISR
jgi:hypothetical protein